MIILSLFMWQRYMIHWWMFAICHNYLLVLLSYLYKLHNPILHIRKTGYRQYHCVIVLNFSMFCQTISIFHKNINSCFKLRNICCCAQLGTEFVCSLTGIYKNWKHLLKQDFFLNIFIQIINKIFRQSKAAELSII